MTMQARDPTELLAEGGKENSAAGGNQTSATMRAKLRNSSDASRRVYESDRFKLVQSRRGSGAASPGHALPASNQDENVEMDRPVDMVPPPAPAAQKKKKEPTPQPVVPDQILEAYLDTQGYVKTRTYIKGKFLGKGGFARCYEVKCDQTGKIYAGKVVAKSSLVKPKAKQKFTSEIKIHKSLHHPQVVQFEHFFEDSDNAYILLELCRNQSMSDLMRRRKRLSESESLIRGILRSDPGARPSLEQILKHPFLADEFVPTTLPRTALLVTPPSCKPPSFASRHSDSERFTRSTGVKVPPPPAASKRYPLKTRDDNQRASDPGTSPSLAQSLPPAYKRDGLGRTSGVSSSNRRQNSTAAERVTHTEAVETSQNALEAAYKSLSRFFYLQEHSRNGGDGRLSASSSAASIVAEAQKLKQIRDEAEEIHPLVPTSLWISQWVDYTSKYGIGYMLSNGGSGVYFNDSTKMISSADGKIFEYIERQSSLSPGPEQQIRYTMDNYDPAINKKVTLLGHFKGYLVDARAENDEADTLESQLARSFMLSSREAGTDTSNSDDGATQSMVFVKKWVKTRHAVLFQLSNGTIQFNFFDKSKLMLASNARVVTYLSRDGDLAVFSSSTAILTPERPDLAKRLRYAKDMLQQMVRPTEHK
ncbi:hypothetical protein Pcac1_g10962 [Phytophthora cactorum]|uniref:Serine/threonine-protein kinase PLK n=1 Tax=Phytophthora cactorum TaxID=29920 RepID=A0A8T1ED89_9STRA|nr:hypothetical protein Pcac1_g10962 [Phytophthora cactorum]KAG2849759.1 hypothetical protein PC112_g8 [Phytophthora cactorum]KAG2952193.1 hypothetical protein PC117_g2978 [Phytophthora cactorum]